MRNGLRIVLLVVLVLATGLAMAAGKRAQRNKLEQSQAGYAASIRWGEFESAWQFVDPDYRAKHPLTELEFERYRQLQISSYRDTGSSLLDDGSVLRSIEVGVINRHTQVERSLRYREHWRWDAEDKRWWLRVGLPDFWGGE